MENGWFSDLVISIITRIQTQNDIWSEKNPFSLHEVGLAREPVEKEDDHTKSTSVFTPFLTKKK